MHKPQSEIGLPDLSDAAGDVNDQDNDMKDYPDMSDIEEEAAFFGFNVAVHPQEGKFSAIQLGHIQADERNQKDCRSLMS